MKLGLKDISGNDRHGTYTAYGVPDTATPLVGATSLGTEPGMTQAQIAATGIATFPTIPSAGTGDFFIEGVAKFGVAVGAAPYNNPLTMPFFGSLTRVGTGGLICSVSASGGTFPQINSLSAAPVGTPFSYAIGRQGMTLRFWIDGVLQGSSTGTGTPAVGMGLLTIGTYADAGFVHDQLRITIGVNRQTGNYTPNVGAFPTGGADPNWANVALLTEMEPAYPGVEMATTSDARSHFVGPYVKDNTPVAPAALAPRSLEHIDRYYVGGYGIITGTLKKKDVPANTPVFRRARLYTEKECFFIAEAWSDEATGAYEFPWVNPSRRYTVIGYDHTGEHQAVIADRVVPAAYGTPPTPQYAAWEDEYFQRVELLLDFNSATDLSLRARPITVVGGVTVAGGAMTFLPNAVTGLSATGGNFFSSSTVDCTTEMWVTITAAPSSGYSDAMGSFFRGTTAGVKQFELARVSAGGAESLITATPAAGGANALPRGTLQHIAVVRQDGNFSTYVDGARVSGPSAGGSWNYDTLLVGSPWGLCGGVYRAVRITNGIARYSGTSFVPPPAPFKAA